ncbi:MAG: hypothetical protein Kow00120_06370 [Anaerolineae bacterium]
MNENAPETGGRKRRYTSWRHLTERFMALPFYEIDDRLVTKPMLVTFGVGAKALRQADLLRNAARMHVNRHAPDAPWRASGQITRDSDGNIGLLLQKVPKADSLEE